MGEAIRVTPEEARRKVSSGAALLICAYDDDEKFKHLHLEGAMSFKAFRSNLSRLSKDQEIIFYCA